MNVKSMQLEFDFDIKDIYYYKNLVYNKLHPIIRSFIGKRYYEVHYLIYNEIKKELNVLQENKHIKNWDVDVTRNELGEDYTFDTKIRIYPNNSPDTYLIDIM